MKAKDFGNGIWTIAGFFSKGECEDWINKSEELGYEAAKVNRGKQQVLLKTVRNNERLIYESEDLAQELWARVQRFVPPTTVYGIACGLNERFRFYKYQPGQVFRPHQDGSFIRHIHEWSSFTFMIYLNEDMVGGETKFNTCSIQPTTGKALIFRHELMQEGSEV
ncbi:MAG: 2OG-Fe(II) oxygenase, partial [Bacteroidota bacterium]